MFYLKRISLLAAAFLLVATAVEAKPKNPVQAHVCKDTLQCIKSKINECHLNDKEIKDLSEWYVKNCTSRRTVIRASAVRPNG